MKIPMLYIDLLYVNFYEVPAIRVIFLLYKIWKVMTGNSIRGFITKRFRLSVGVFVGRICFWVRFRKRWGRK